MERPLKVIVSCVLLLCFPRVVSAADDSITIGYLLDLSGKGAFVGQQSQAGALLAERELNAVGTKVHVVFEDHRTDAKTGVTTVRKLLSTDKADAILCDLTPPCTTASPIVAAEKKLFVYQAPIVSLLSANPYAFKDFLDYELGCKEIAKYWKQKGVKKIAHFKVNAEFGELCLQGAKEVYPEQEVFAYDANEDLRPLVIRLKASGVEGVIQTGYEADYINRLRATGEIGLTVLNGMPQPLLTENVIRSIGPELASSVVTFGFPTIAQDFVLRLKAAELYRGETSIESAAIAYLHVKQVAAALKACPAGEGQIICQVMFMSSSPQDLTLGFTGWQNREAVYQTTIRAWKEGTFHDLSTLPVADLGERK